MTVPNCTHSGRPITECPTTEEWATPSEYDSTLEHVRRRCTECGRISFATREANADDTGEQR